MRAAAENHAPHRADIAEVAAPAEHHMLVPHHQRIGGVEIHPSRAGPEPGADPGMALVGAAAPRLARGGRVRM